MLVHPTALSLSHASSPEYSNLQQQICSLSMWPGVKHVAHVLADLSDSLRSYDEQFLARPFDRGSTGGTWVCFPRIRGFDQDWWHLLPSSLLHWRPLLHKSGGLLLYVFFYTTYGLQSFKLGNGLPCVCQVVQMCNGARLAHRIFFASPCALPILQTKDAQSVPQTCNKLKKLCTHVPARLGKVLYRNWPWP